MPTETPAKTKTIKLRSPNLTADAGRPDGFPGVAIWRSGPENAWKPDTCICQTRTALARIKQEGEKTPLFGVVFPYELVARVKVGDKEKWVNSVISGKPVDTGCQDFGGTGEVEIELFDTGYSREILKRREETLRELRVVISE